MSVRACYRQGSAISVAGRVHAGSTGNARQLLSVASFQAAIGSTLSIRRYGRFGSACSMLQFQALGSSMSVRNFARLGSNLSITGKDAAHAGLGANACYAMSIISAVGVGSCCSVRSSCRFGSKMSALDFFTLASSLSIRGYARIGSGLSVYGLTALAKLSGGVSILS